MASRRRRNSSIARGKTPKTHARKTYKVAQQVFHEYLLEKGIAEPTEKSEIARVLKRF